LDGAISDLDIAIAFDPGYAAAFSIVGGPSTTNEISTAQLKITAGRLRSTHASLRPTTIVAPRSRKRELDHAWRIATRLSRSSHLADAYSNRGNVRTPLADLDGAIADFTRAIRIAPRLGPAYYNRGVVRYLKGEMSGAISDYDRSIKINPRYVEAYCNRGAAKRANGDVEGAIADYSAAIAIDPGLTLAYLNRGLAR
jgi:tetratricopeptide (TPR) repeat protein